MNKLLITDDQDLIITLMRRFCETLGFSADYSLTGSGSLEILRAHPEDYSVALLDYRLPDIDGVELAKKFKDIAPGLKIVLTTGDECGNAVFTELIRSGTIVSVLSKPFTFDDIRNLLNSL